MATLKLSRETTNGQDAWVDSLTTASKATNYGHTTTLRVCAGTPTRRAYFVPFVPSYLYGATIIDSYLHVKIAVPVTANNTLRARAVTSAWIYNRVTYNLQPNRSSTVYADGPLVTSQSGWVVIDVGAIMALVAAGTLKWYGLAFELLTADGKTLYLASMDAATADRPYITTTYSRKPDAPTVAEPSGDKAIGTLAPPVAWNYHDADGDGQSAFQVIVTDDVGATVRDSGKVTDPAHTYTPPALASWNTYYRWKVRVWDTYDVVSSYSGLFRFRTNARPAVAITAPGVTTDSLAPIVAWSYADAEGQAWYRAYLQQLVGGVWTTLYDSGVINSAVASHRIPRGYIKVDVEATYRVIIYVADQVQRSVLVGQANYAAATQEFTLALAAITPVAALTAVNASAGLPGVSLTWTRATSPDDFDISRYRKREAVVDVPEWELVDTIDGTARSYTDHTCPSTDVTYQVVAVEDDRPSDGNPTVTARPRFVPFWLVCPEHPEYNCPLPAWDSQNPDMTLAEDADVFAPIGRRDKVFVTRDVKGIEGSISTVFYDGALPGGITARDAYLRLQNLRMTDSPVYLLTRWQSWQVFIRDLKLTPDSSLPGAYSVALTFSQTGGFDVSG